MKPEEQVRADFEAWWRATWDVETKFHVDSAGRYLEEDQRNAFYGYRAAYAQARREALEEAAEACGARYMGDNNREDQEALNCANAIRALIKD